MNIDFADTLMSCKHYAAFIGCSQPHVTRLCQNEVIDYTRIGGFLLIVMTPKSRTYQFVRGPGGRPSKAEVVFTPHVPEIKTHNTTQQATLRELGLDYLIRTG